MSAAPPVDMKRYMARVNSVEPLCWTGEVVELVGLVVESRGPAVALGDFCEIQTTAGRHIRTQVVGFRNGRVLSMPLDETEGLRLHDRVVARQEQARIAAGPGLLGRVLDGLGVPMDGGPPVQADRMCELFQPPVSPLEREPITEPLATGIRAIDGLLPCGKGQRIGIFGGSGVGKSTLLGAMARHSSADVNVIALVGERNREVREFLEHELGPEGRNAFRGGGGHFRSSRAPARARLFRGAGRSRVFPRSRGECPAGYGLGNAPGDGAA